MASVPGIEETETAEAAQDSTTEAPKRRRKTRRNKVTSHDSFLSYASGRWWKIAAALCAVSIVLYLAVPLPAQHFGGTWLGYTLGTIGAGLIVWLTLLGVRKRAITPGTWSLKAWTSAHVYLGLSLIVVATLHTGFDFGWNVHTLAWGLMMLVIVSGMYGIWAYWRLPEALSDNRYDEDGAVTEKQMIEQLRSLDRQIHDAAQPLAPEDAATVEKSLEQDPFEGSAWNRLTARYPNCETRAAASTLREARAFRPRVADDPLDRVDALLTRKEAVLARLRRHLRIKSVLQVWLYVHVPVTFALLAALSAHIVSVFFYW